VWFRDSVLDYVFSSHCLEDFTDTQAVLREWARVLKPGGRIVLFLPDQQTYVRHCAEKCEIPNAAHKLPHFSLAWVKECGAALGNLAVVHELWPVPGNAYSFDLVFQKTESCQ
jgi:ubiquinone/menaquinone biosynthesis C-methylase UbiE